MLFKKEDNQTSIRSLTDEKNVSQNVKEVKSKEGIKKWTLRDYKEGQRGTIIELVCTGKLKKRLIEMGLVKGTSVYVEKYAPLRDPIELIVKGYHVSIRREEAQHIIMSPPE